MRQAELAWLGALFLLMVFESWAVGTGHMTLSRAVWELDHKKYGTLLPFLAGMVAGHFFWSGQ